MRATDHLQADRLSHIHEIQEKRWKLDILRIFHRSEINYLEWRTPEEMLEKLLELKKPSHLNYIKKVIYMRNKVALLFLIQLLPQEKKME